MILYLAGILWIICIVIYGGGLLLGNKELEIFGMYGALGIIIGLIPQVFVLGFELSGVAGVLLYLVILFILIWILREGGPGMIYTIGIFALAFGYLFTGPYSGYLKTYTGALSEPLGLAIDSLQVTGYDLFLMITDPQAYLDRKAATSVRVEKPTSSYPKGIEFKKVTTLPDNIPSEQEFYIQVFAENEGLMPANAILSVYCLNDICCDEGAATCGYTAGMDYYPAESTPITLRPNEVILQRFGPFVAKAFKKQDIGKRAEVNVSLHYAHSTSSRLMVTVMNQEEVRRIMTDPVEGDVLFRQEVSVGKNSPGMVALTVGYQPLMSGDNSEQVLIVSVVNKRPKGTVILDTGAELRVHMPQTIGYGLTCKAGAEMSCSGDGQDVLCTVSEQIEPITPKILYYPITCTFNTMPYVETSVTDAITANLTGYTFEIAEKAGARISMSYKPFVSTTEGDGEGGEEPTPTIPSGGGTTIPTTTMPSGGGTGTSPSGVDASDVNNVPACVSRCGELGYPIAVCHVSDVCASFPQCGGDGYCYYDCTRVGKGTVDAPICDEELYRTCYCMRSEYCEGCPQEQSRCTDEGCD